MIFKMKTNVIVDLPKKVFILSYLLFRKKNNATFIIKYARKKYSDPFISQRILQRMAQPITGTQGWGSKFGTTKCRTTGISKFRNCEY